MKVIRQPSCHVISSCAYVYVCVCEYSFVVATFCWPFHRKDILLCNILLWEHFSIQHLMIDILSSLLLGAFRHAILHHWHFIKSAGYGGNSSVLTLSILHPLITFLHTELSFTVPDVNLSLWKDRKHLLHLPTMDLLKHLWELHLMKILHVSMYIFKMSSKVIWRETSVVRVKNYCPWTKYTQPLIFVKKEVSLEHSHVHFTCCL